MLGLVIAIDSMKEIMTFSARKLAFNIALA